MCGLAAIQSLRCWAWRLGAWCASAGGRPVLDNVRPPGQGPAGELREGDADDGVAGERECGHGRGEALGDEPGVVCGVGVGVEEDDSGGADQDGVYDGTGAGDDPVVLGGPTERAERLDDRGGTPGSFGMAAHGLLGEGGSAPGSAFAGGAQVAAVGIGGGVDGAAGLEPWFGRVERDSSRGHRAGRVGGPGQRVGAERRDGWALRRGGLRTAVRLVCHGLIVLRLGFRRVARLCLC